jgi:2-oxoacid:acceptor oxidoreductase delta subunit (pyruvate/2-ketoisovalerate family)
VRGIPPVAESETSTLATRTGSWKYVWPAYHDRVAPCNQACPVGIDIEGYMNLLREGRIAEARRLLLLENPMPAVTGRVCHHPCETACHRRNIDEPVAIHAVERMLGDITPTDLATEQPATKRAERIAIVGSGPAGLSCSYHLARAGYGVTVFESEAEPGGMLRLGIPAYRLPREALDRDIDRIRAAGVEIRCGVRVGHTRSWPSVLGEYSAVFLAAGAHESRPLGVPGEDAPGIRSGLDFLREINRGGAPQLGRTVVVIGGGNTAMDCARSALRLGARVTVLYRRTRAEMPAIAAEVEEAEREGVSFVFLAAPTGFIIADDALTAVVCERMTPGELDAGGRRLPVATGDRFTLPAASVLTAIGEGVDPATIPDGVEAGAGGVTVDDRGATSRPAVFAGGDVTHAPRTVADALGAGKRAAIGIHRYLRAAAGDRVDPVPLDALRFAKGNVSAARWLRLDPVHRVAPLNEVVPLEAMNAAHYPGLPRHPDTHTLVDAEQPDFAEVNQGLTRAQALAEARRCLNCGVCTQCDLCLIFCPDVAISRDGDGAYSIALDYCKGCGVCAAECPRGAITMTRDEP